MKRSGKYAPRSKSVSVNTVPEVNLAKLDRKISGNTNSPTFDTESKLAVDNHNRFNNSITNITTHIHSSLDDYGSWNWKHTPEPPPEISNGQIK